LTSSVTTACENGAFGKTRLQFLLQHTVIIFNYLGLMHGKITLPRGRSLCIGYDDNMNPSELESNSTRGAGDVQ
jgi:hypothetical protein